MSESSQDPCLRFREKLQDSHDRGAAPAGELAAHLSGCPGCRAFHALLGELGSGLSAGLERELAGLPPLDFPALYRRAQRRRSEGRKAALLLSVAAGAFLFLLVGGTNLFLYRQQAARRRESVDYVIERLFSRPFLKGVEPSGALAVPAGLSAWFSALAEDGALAENGALVEGRESY